MSFRAAIRIVALFAIPLAAGSCLSRGTETTNMRVKIVSNPPGAWVTYSSPSGEHSAGNAPVDLDIAYRTDYVRYNRAWWLFPSLSVALTAVGLPMLFATKENPPLFAAFSVIGTIGLIGGIAMCAYFETEAKEDVHSEAYRVIAQLEDYLPAERLLDIPSEVREISFDLVRDPASPALMPGERRKILVVFTIQDPGGRLSSELLDQLTTYLTARMGQLAKIQVAPRDQLAAALRNAKKEQAEACEDQACQIEIGRALAASKLLSTSLLRVGESCALTSKLYDLKTEVAEGAASAKTDCSEDALMNAVDRVVGELAKAL